MEDSKGIVALTKTILERVQDIDDIIDKALEPVKDYSDTIGDIVAPVKSIVSIINLRKKMAFKSFLKKYSECLVGKYNLSNKETIKLEKYFEKNENLHFVSEIIENGISARSIKCSSILGLIAGMSIKEKKEFNNSDLIIISSLKEMTDFDLDNFVELYNKIEFITWGKRVEANELLNREFRTLEFYNEQSKGKLNMDKDSLDLTIEKLKRTGALSYGEGGIGSIGNSRGAFIFTNTTVKLYDIINESNILLINN
jgi:hypothetical protein